MADNLKNDPGTRLRNMLGSASSTARLPKKEGDAASFLPKLPKGSVPASSNGGIPPTVSASPVSARSAKKFSIGPVFWTISSIVSLTVNVVLVIILFFVYSRLQKAKLADVTALGPNLLGGLYTNFEKMDQAHITTNISVQTTIPVKFDLQLNQQTNVVLSENVTITNALVTVNTGGLNITRAATTIVLPQGTTLPVFLNLTVPVDTTVPVVLNVPVDIPLEQTQLHEPFVGLREVVAPLYCLFNSEAVGINGQPVCK